MKISRGYVLGVGISAAVLACLQFAPPVAMAQPFGKGVYGADVPFGSLTSLSIDLSGSVGMTLSPSGPNLYGTGSHVVTITSIDVVGYSLYMHNPTTTSMSNGGDTIPASSNTVAAPLAAGSWGYNTDGSSNFVGLTTTPELIRDRNGPYKNGDDTTVTYGVLTDTSQVSGTYTVDVTYTAIGKS